MLLIRFPRLARLVYRTRAYLAVTMLLGIAAGIGFGIAYGTSDRLETTQLAAAPVPAAPATPVLKPSEGSVIPVVEKPKKARRPRVRKSRPPARRKTRRARRRVVRAAPAPAPIAVATPAPTAAPAPAATAAPPPPPVRRSAPPKPQSKPGQTFDSSG